MKNVKVIRKVKLSLTADDWEFYEKPGRDRAAEQLNFMVESALNSEEDRTFTWSRIETALNLCSSFGAADSEGRYIASALMGLVFDPKTGNRP